MKSDEKMTASDPAFPSTRSKNKTPIISYDLHLRERIATQWQFGDWDSLTSLDDESIRNHPDRVVVALFSAVAHFQKGSFEIGKKYLRLAMSWGGDKKLIARFLCASVHDHLANVNLLIDRGEQARFHLKNALCAATPGCESRLLEKSRLAHRIAFLEERQFFKKPVTDAFGLPGEDKNNCEISTTTNTKQPDRFQLKEYWDDRYRAGRGSGSGSYGKLAEFKASVINEFIEKNNIGEMIDLGCGDGNQASMFKIDKYVGIDISSFVVDECKKLFHNDSGKNFFVYDEFRGLNLVSDLVVSFDVIFHLIEDDDYNEYMNTLFCSSRKYVVVYGADSDSLDSKAAHVKGRVFTAWVANFAPAWELFAYRKNDYPYERNKSQSLSSYSDFYFFRKVEK